ncbi:MAG: CPBP family intramembrane metalloprotease [Planctomycetes bacterium]|nr:CPBP family intramembrane metalloprotease [Planctomycetota bacterium]
MDDADTGHGEGPVDRCAYCGAELDRRFYFCRQCATPYRREEEVLPRVGPGRISGEQLIARKAPQVWSMFWTYVTVVLFCGPAAYLLLGEESPGTWLALATAAVFITTAVFAAMHWQSLVVQLKRIGFNRAEAFAGLALLAPLLGINYLISAGLKNMGMEEAARGEAFGEIPRGLLFLLVCVFPAVTEEIAFRGLMLHWLLTAIKPWQALALSSFLFAALHGSIIGLPYLFMVGMLLGWMKWRTGSLYPSMAAHFVHNWAVLDYL